VKVIGFFFEKFTGKPVSQTTGFPSVDKEFVTKALSDNNYKGPEDVVKALLNKV